MADRIQPDSLHRVLGDLERRLRNLERPPVFPAILPELASAPSPLIEGAAWIDSGTGKLKFVFGGVVRTVTSAP